ncbi:MAG: hypothetical protein N3G20_10765 [Verrucomicrobiae bacterium]|nr:hypothetical protein [Verrucomicrobiae bacterium]
MTELIQKHAELRRQEGRSSKCGTSGQAEMARQGVALIMVVGLLAVLLLLAVAFAISMRTENAAAGHHREIVMCRQLVYAGLSRALQDIEQNLTKYRTEPYPTGWSTQALPNIKTSCNLYMGEVTNLLPRLVVNHCAKLPSKGYNLAAGGLMIVDSNSVWSPGSLNGYVIETDRGYEVITGNSTNTIGPGTNPFGGWYRIADPAIPQWTPIGNGRAAYLIINLSGLLDANFVGGPAGSRKAGSSVGELDIAQLSEVRDPAKLFAARPFESLYDLRLRGGLVPEPRHFHDYARCPAEVDGFEPVPIVGLKADEIEKKKDKIREAFMKAVVNCGGDKADVLVRNLLDYVDDDYVPGVTGEKDVTRDTDGPYVEMIPMLNEVMVTNRIAITGSNQIDPAVSRIGVWAEWFYPFVSNATESFELAWEYEYVPQGSLPFLPSGRQKGTLNIARPGAGRLAAVPLGRPVVPSGANPTNVDFEVKFYSLEVKWKGIVVDRLPVEDLSRYGWSFRVSLRGLRPGTNAVQMVGYEAVDPRLNYNADLVGGGWRKSMDAGRNVCSPSDTNYWTKIEWLKQTTDGGWHSFVANRPIKTVGELGCLFSTAKRVPLEPWKTIWLYDRRGNGQWDKVLDYFANTNNATTIDGKLVYQGRINPNTEIGSALATAFYQMRVDSFYGDTLGSAPLTWSEAGRLARSIQNHLATNAPLARLSELGSAGIATNVINTLRNMGKLPSRPSELQKEAFYRNVADLLHPRQNLFAIIIAGQTAHDPNRYDVPKTDQRALAIVWRDPVKNKQGRHPCFIRWFTWLEK